MRYGDWKCAEKREQKKNNDGMIEMKLPGRKKKLRI